MKARIANLAALLLIQIPMISQAAERNCRWQAEHSSNQFYTEREYRSFQACSIYVRSLILGSNTNAVGVYGKLAVGSETDGTLTFEYPNGTKRVCRTRLSHPEAKRLDENEYLSSSVYAAWIGTHLNYEERVNASQILNSLGVKPLDVVRKIDESLILICDDPVS